MTRNRSTTWKSLRRQSLKYNTLFLSTTHRHSSNVSRIEYYFQTLTKTTLAHFKLYVPFEDKKSIRDHKICLKVEVSYHSQ